MTPEQQKALAIAKARRRRAEAEKSPQIAADAGLQQSAAQVPETAANAFAANAQSPLGGLQKIDDGMRGLANGLTSGLADRFAGMMSGDGTQAEREKSAQAQKRSPIMYTGGEIGGSIAGLGKIAQAGGTAMRLVPQGLTGAKGLVAKALAGSVDGLAANELMNAGYGRDFGENALSAGVLGASAPAVAGAVTKGLDLGKATLGIGNQDRARQAIAEALSRSGKSPDDISRELSRAIDDGQPEYILADALGNSGQRMLSGVARSPGDMRQKIAETLLSRQAGQADRLTNALVEGFDAPMTAAQKTTQLEAARRAQAAPNYKAAKEAAGAVDTSQAISAIDEIVSPGLTKMIGAGAKDNGVYATLKRARGLLTNGKSQVSDYERAFLAKQEMDAMIEQGGVVANALRPARNALDEALAKASYPYAAARDAYRQGSKAIEAVDTGISSASARLRSQDTIPAFSRMDEAQKSAFRSGYVDPLISRVQGSATGSMTDKSRALITPKTKAEFAAFAAPGRAPQLANRLSREQAMFATNSAALGGSKTADNIQDLAEMQGIDPSMVANFLTGNWRQAMLSGITKSANALSGRNQATRDMIAEALMRSGKDGSKQIAQALEAGKKLTKNQEAIARALLASGLVMTRAQ